MNSSSVDESAAQGTTALRPEMPRDLDLAALEIVAREAAKHLPGEWRTDTNEDEPSRVAFLDHHAGEERWLDFAHCSGGCLEWLSASAHIAAFDPPTVLRLIQMAKASQSEAKLSAGNAGLDEQYSSLLSRAQTAEAKLGEAVESLRDMRVFVQDCLDTGHDRGSIGNLMAVRDIIDRLSSTLQSEQAEARKP